LGVTLIKLHRLATHGGGKGQGRAGQDSPIFQLFQNKAISLRKTAATSDMRAESINGIHSKPLQCEELSNDRVPQWAGPHDILVETRATISGLEG
jgi:hypothetical protein